MSGAAAVADVTDLVPSASNSDVHGEEDSAETAGSVYWLLSTHEEPHRLKSAWCLLLLKNVWLKLLRAAEHCRDVGLFEAQIVASS